MHCMPQITEHFRQESCCPRLQKSFSYSQPLMILLFCFLWIFRICLILSSPRSIIIDSFHYSSSSKLNCLPIHFYSPCYLPFYFPVSGLSFSAKYHSEIYSFRISKITIQILYQDNHTPLHAIMGQLQSYVPSLLVTWSVPGIFHFGHLMCWSFSCIPSSHPLCLSE